VAEASSLRCSGWKPLPLWVATLREGHTLVARPSPKSLGGLVALQ